MRRAAVRALTAALAVALLFEYGIGQQPGAAPDRVIVRSAVKKDGSTVTYEGKLKLSAVGLQILSGEKLDKATTISFADIVKLEPGDLSGVNREDMLSQLKLENNRTRKDYETAKSVYINLLKKASAAPEPTKRHLEYRIALMSTKIADVSGDDEQWAELAEIAAKEWTGFLTGYKSGWEIWPAARALARLYVEQGKFDEGARLWGRMAKNPELPPDLKLEASIEEIDAQFRVKAFATAASLAAELGQSAAPGAGKDKLALYERAAKAAEAGLKEDSIQPVVDEIKKRISASKDAGVRAVGFSVAGELYLLANRPRDAMWEFLAVETLYNSNKDDVLKAMCRLAQSFQAQMDEDRRKQYRDKIRHYRSSF
jgi:hypothetical protein